MVLLTTREAAELLRCHEKTVRRMIGRGEIRGVFIAGKWLIAEDALPTSLPPRPAPPLRRPGQLGEASALARRIAGAASRAASTAAATGCGSASSASANR